MVARSYLRASTDEQDATRARAAVESFAAERGLNIVGKYVENESGAKLARPELFRLTADSRPDDVLLIEQVDRLSRLTAADWQKLRADLNAKQNPCRCARSSDKLDAGGSGRRLHRAHVPGAQSDDARYALRYRPQAL